MTHHATPSDLFKRAILLEHEAETFSSVGLDRHAFDLRSRARTLRRLSKEASPALGSNGE